MGPPLVRRLLELVAAAVLGSLLTQVALYDREPSIRAPQGGIGEGTTAPAAQARDAEKCTAGAGDGIAHDREPAREAAQTAAPPAPLQTTWTCSRRGMWYEECQYENLCVRANGEGRLTNAYILDPNGAYRGVLEGKGWSSGNEFYPDHRVPVVVPDEPSVVPIMADWEYTLVADTRQFEHVTWSSESTWIGSGKHRTLSNIWYFALHTVTFFDAYFHMGEAPERHMPPPERLIVPVDKSNLEAFEWNTRFWDAVVPNKSAAVTWATDGYYQHHLERPGAVLCMKRALLLGSTGFLASDMMAAFAVRRALYRAADLPDDNLVAHRPMPLNVYFLDRVYDRRNVRNAGEILDCLRRLGIDPVYGFTFGDSWVDAVQTLRNTSILITPHGAGLANLIAMPAGAVVIELTTFKFKLPLYKVIAQLYGIHHLYVAQEDGGLYDPESPDWDLYRSLRCADMSELDFTNAPDCFSPWKDRQLLVPLLAFERAVREAMHLIGHVPPSPPPSS